MQMLFMAEKDPGTALHLIFTLPNCNGFSRKRVSALRLAAWISGQC